MPGKLRQLVLKTTMAELYASGGNRTRAAKELGISVRTLRNYIKALNLGGYGPVPPPPLPSNAGESKYTHETPCPCSSQKCKNRASLHHKMERKKASAAVRANYCPRCGSLREGGGCLKCPPGSP